MRKLFVMVAMFACLATAAQANTIVDFGTGSGTHGIANSLTNTGTGWFGYMIPVPVMTVIDAPKHDGASTVNLWLNFKYDPTTTDGDLNWFNIVGKGNKPYLPGLYTTLFYTAFEDVRVEDTPNGVNFTFTGSAIANPALLAYLGLPENTPFALYGTMQAYETDCGYKPYSTDISMTAVPEPASLTLFATGLFGLAGIVRKRTKK